MDLSIPGRFTGPRSARWRASRVFPAAFQHQVVRPEDPIPHRHGHAEVAVRELVMDPVVATEDPEIPGWKAP